MAENMTLSIELTPHPSGHGIEISITTLITSFKFLLPKEHIQAFRSSITEAEKNMPLVTTPCKCVAVSTTGEPYPACELCDGKGVPKGNING